MFFRSWMGATWFFGPQQNMGGLRPRPSTVGTHLVASPEVKIPIPSVEKVVAPSSSPWVSAHPNLPGRWVGCWTPPATGDLGQLSRLTVPTAPHGTGEPRPAEAMDSSGIPSPSTTWVGSPAVRGWLSDGATGAFSNTQPVFTTDPMYPQRYWSDLESGHCWW